ncbi:glycine cleavage system aminomethyltransferase GcvT [Pedosphaera parvula]|uniref:Aminomethyltransferase n=1 Tax=Pedosphaera parvula (strain Ellin514) TaxID=320771 RepID=B9XM90_PEDPL|nr:glycine cleavage system aminomethyltransferase GcvT [Pedosphaera parvula]EEF59083.1 glycine cleavage system T protein [Pedosphaera parvula Ellin514]
MLKRTPLFDIHQKLGGRLVEFGGWEMPVQYTSIMDEHQVVRKAGGLFDISHMGEVLVSGSGAEEFLNHTLTNDIRKLAVGGGQYTLMCNEQGGVIDDLYAYRLAGEEYLLIINASRIDVDVPWLESQLAAFAKKNSVTLKNTSEQTGAVALQGPRVSEFINQCFPGTASGGTAVASPSELKKNQIARFSFSGKPVWVSRTGYTGEDGFEIVAPAEIIGEVWSRIMTIGHQYCLQPAGLGARDTLRTEVCYPLYGHELDEQTTPIEAGLGFFVSFDKGDFVGRAVLAGQKASGVTKKCIAFKMTDKSAPPRPHYPIWSTGPNPVQIGEVVSGTQSPSLGNGIGMGYVKTEFAKAQTPIEIEIRGKRAAALIVSKPLYKKPV